jgi:hypothetical protein
LKPQENDEEDERIVVKIPSKEKLGSVISELDGLIGVQNVGYCVTIADQVKQEMFNKIINTLTE